MSFASWFGSQLAGTGDLDLDLDRVDPGADHCMATRGRQRPDSRSGVVLSVEHRGARAVPPPKAIPATWKASPRAWSRPERTSRPPAAATGPRCHHEPYRHCRPGGTSVPSSRAAATRTLPPGGPRATPMLRSGRIRACTRRSSAQPGSPGRAAGPVSPPAPRAELSAPGTQAQTLVIPSTRSSTWLVRRSRQLEK